MKSEYVNIIKTILGYILFVIHLIFSSYINFGWLFITNIFYLHVLIFWQLITLLSWGVFGGKCIITMLENLLLDNHTKHEMSITGNFIFTYLPYNIASVIFIFGLSIMLFITLLKKLHIKYN